MPTATLSTDQLALIAEHLGDWLWRIDNLYTVTDEKGRRGPFHLRPAQRDSLVRGHTRNLNLKARQLGFTTQWAIFGLDQCFFHGDTSALFIAQDVDKAQDTFTKKIRAGYNDLPLCEEVPAKTDSTRQLVFGNRSSITVDTSGRGGTFQFVHVSELGKIAAKWPAKAREINTGTFNAVPPEGVIVVESTAEGQSGLFYDMCQTAIERSMQPEPLHALEFKFFFYPWWIEQRYSVDPTHVIVPAELHRYFDELETQLNDLIEQRRAPEWLRVAASLTPEHPGWVVLDAAQRAWYALTAGQQKDDMKREYPSTPEEAFAASIEGAFYKRELARCVAQGRYGDWPYDPALGAVFTDHDIGRGVHAIWWKQRDGGHWRYFAYRELHHGGVSQVANLLNEERDKRDLVYGRHYLPHDGGTKDWSADLQRADELASRLGVTRDVIEVVPRTKDVFADHQTVKNYLELSRFDRQGCALGWAHLGSYRREYSDTLGTYLNKEHEGVEVHGADAYRTGAMADFHGMIMDDSLLGREERRQAARHEEEAGRNARTGY